MPRLLLVILDGLPWRNARRLMGNLEGWVETGEARVRRMRAVLPSTSASCYASLHTGTTPQTHGVTGNDAVVRVGVPDIFSAASKAGLKTGAVAHSFFSGLFQRAPFDAVRDLEVDDSSLPIRHGRFYTMTGYAHHNYMCPSDADLFAQLTVMVERHGIDYGLLHTCTPDSMGHAFGADGPEMEKSLFTLDAQLATFIRRWRAAGCEVIVTADHGQMATGHHGGADPDMRDVALYYFGEGEIAEDDPLLQTRLAPSVLARLGVPIPDTMREPAFLEPGRATSPAS